MLHSRLAALCLVSLVGFAGPLTAGNITVGAVGADYTDLVAAVQAAAPGDIVFVAEGDYLTLGLGLVIEKPLTIIGAGSLKTTFRSGYMAQVGSSVPLVIQNLSAGQEVRVIGINMEAEALCFCPDPLVGPELVKILNCAGPVTLGDVTGYSDGGADSGTFEIVNSLQVVLDGVHARAEALGPGMRIVSSFVTLNDCGITGGFGSEYFFGPHPDGFPGIDATDSSVWLSRCGVSGGDGRGKQFIPIGDFLPGVGAPGLLGVSSDFHVRGEELRWIEGGRGAVGLHSGTPVFTIGASAVALSPDSQLETTPGAKLFAGSDGNFVVTQPDVSASGTWLQHSEWLAMLKFKAGPLGLSENLAQIGTSKLLEVSGHATSLVVPFASLAQVPSFPIPGFHGFVLLDPSAYLSFPFVQLDASGRAEFSLPVPNLPALIGTTAIFQGLGLSPSGITSTSLGIPLAIIQ